MENTPEGQVSAKVLGSPPPTIREPNIAVSCLLPPQAGAGEAEATLIRIYRRAAIQLCVGHKTSLSNGFFPEVASVQNKLWAIV